MTPTVSVIIPTYKHRDFVLATLDSVFAQTFMDYEVIVINDGSPDDTAEVLRPLAESGRIRYIEQKNTGQARARNRGIEEAQGKFIALLDDDDLWPPDKLQWQVKVLEGRPELGMIAGPATIIDGAGRPVERSSFVPELSFTKSFSGTHLISPGQTLIRAALLKELNGLNPDIWGADDWDLWLRILKKSRIVMEDREALLYRRHEGNASNNLCRMLDNSLRVVHLHLPDVAAGERKAVARKANEFLYYYVGRQILIALKQSVKAGQVRHVPAYLLRVTRLAAALIQDPVMVKLIATDLFRGWRSTPPLRRTAS